MFGLERVPLPAIVTDRRGDLVWANDRFKALVKKQDIRPGKAIKKIISLDLRSTSPLNFAHPEEMSLTPPSVIIGEQTYTMHVESIGMLVGSVFIASEENPLKIRALDTSSRLPPGDSRILEAFYLLSEELNRGQSDENLILLFLKVYQDLFPDRLLCIKLFDQETREFQQIYANGRLKEESHSSVRLSNRSVIEHGLDTKEGKALLREAKIIVTGEYLPIFEDGIQGFDIPLYDGRVLYGILNFEYWKNQDLLPMDRTIAVPVAHQMSASLRNAALISETTFLKDYLEKLLDQANAPVIVVDEERQVTVFNQAMERQTGYSRETYLGQDIIHFIPEPEKERIASVLLGAILGEPQTGVEINIPKADGTGETNLVFNLAPIRSQENDREGIILVGQDLTEIKRLQRQVIRTEKLATLGQVAAGVAHEVSNPLTFITVYANYLSQKLTGVIDPKDSEKIKRIVEAAARIQTFTRELVTYGRPSRETPRLLDVTSLLERARSFCEHLIEKSRAEVTLHVTPDIRQIHGIRGHLEQVFVNLFTNACHAFGKMGGHLLVDAHNKDDQWIIITVEDSGCGIAQDDIKMIFEPFFTTKPEGQGTGLGLSIVRNILAEHNGDIEVRSNPDKGTVFTVTLPAN